MEDLDLNAPEVDGAALARARRREEATYPELSGANGRARLVVLGCEVGGRWSDECQSFLRQLSKARVRHEPPDLRASARVVAKMELDLGLLRLPVSGSVVVGSTRGSWRRWSHTYKL